MALPSIRLGWCMEQVPSHLQTFTQRKVKYCHHHTGLQQDVHRLLKGFQTECLSCFSTSACVCIYMYIYVYIYIYIWVNYNDLTATSLRPHWNHG